MAQTSVISGLRASSESVRGLRGRTDRLNPSALTARQDLDSMLAQSSKTLTRPRRPAGAPKASAPSSLVSGTDHLPSRLHPEVLRVGFGSAARARWAVSEAGRKTGWAYRLSV